MKAFKFTLIAFACLLSGFTYSHESRKRVSFSIKNTATYTFAVRTPSFMQLDPDQIGYITMNVGEQLMFMKMFKKHPLFVVTPEMSNTVIDVTGTAKLRNKGDAETIIYIKPPRKAPKPKRVAPASPPAKKRVPPPPPPVIQEEYSGEIFTIVQDMPRFVGCEQADYREQKKCSDMKMLEHVYKNIRYPTVSRKSKIEGTVIVSFIIERDGKVNNAEVIRSVDENCDREALRVINSMPNWIPGKQRNQPVRVQFNLPIKFKLQG